MPCSKGLLCETMCRDHAKRLTPEKALQHPWLADIAAVVQDRAAAALVAPLYQQQTQLLVELFSTVPAVIMPQQERTTLLLPIKQQQEEDTIPINEAESSDLPTVACTAQQGGNAAQYHPDVGCAATMTDMPANAADHSNLEAHSISSGSSCSCMLPVLNMFTTAMKQLPTDGTDVIQSARAPSLLQRGKALMLKLSRSDKSKSKSNNTSASREGVSSASGFVKNLEPDAIASQQVAASTKVILGTTGACMHSSSCCSDGGSLCVSLALSA